MFRPPFEVVSSVLVNAAIVIGIWFFINPSIVLRHTALVFCLSPSVRGLCQMFQLRTSSRARRTTRDRVHDADFIRRVMTVQNLALWVLISLTCMLLSLALIPSGGNATVSIAIAIAVLVLPFPYMGLAAIVAPLLPLPSHADPTTFAATRYLASIRASNCACLLPTDGSGSTHCTRPSSSDLDVRWARPDPLLGRGNSDDSVVLLPLAARSASGDSHRDSSTGLA